MLKERVPVERIIFLFILVAVFLYTYLADLNIFAAILQAISFSAPFFENFIMLFIILSFASLSVYYFLKKKTHSQVSERFLLWLRLFTWACWISFLLSVAVIYLNIYFNKTFDVT